MNNFSFSIKDASGQVCAVVTSPTPRQAFWNAVLVVRTMQDQARDALPAMPPVYYAEPCALQ